MRTKKLENAVTQIKVTFDKKEWAEAQDAALKRLATRVKLDGFRPGKAPVAMIKARLGKQAIYDEATDQILQKRYADIMKKAEVAPIAQPTLNIDSVDNDNLKITILCPVKPEVELGEYKGLEVKKGRVTVAKKDIEAQVENYRHQFAELTTKENGEVAKGDTVVMDFEGFIDGEAFEGGKAENHSLEIGSGQFIPGFEDQMIGMTCENEKDVVVTFPEDYQAKDLAGKAAVFKVKVHEIKKKELPEINDEFAQDVSEFDTLDEYKEDVKKGIAEQKEKAVRQEKQEKIIRQIVENAEMDIPDPMVITQTRQMMDQFAQQMQSNGLSMAQYYQFTGLTPDGLLEQMKPQAQKNIENRLVLEAIAAAEGITASEEEVEKEFANIAERYGLTVDKVKEIFADEETENIKSDIAAQKALDMITEAAVEVPVTEVEATVEDAE